MAFRIGKSVMLNFGQDMEPIFIFVGLTLLLLIGPLLRWYVLSMTRPNWRILKPQLLELIPFVFIFGASLFVTRTWYENSNWVLLVFASGLIFIYLHLAFYIGYSWQLFRLAKKNWPSKDRTKSQSAVFRWLHLLLIGFVFIWGCYVLNILDDAVPYVIGPLVYSVVVYFLSVKAFQLKASELDGAVFKKSSNQQLFLTIDTLVVAEKLYLQSDLSLSKLSGRLGRSAQHISLAVNEHAKRNFNDYINYYRIQDAKQMLASPDTEKFTIATIAYDVGFSSLSSFNGAFKKFEGTTPSAFRNSR